MGVGRVVGFLLVTAVFLGSAACCCPGRRTHTERVIERQQILVPVPGPGPSSLPATDAPAPTLGRQLEDLNNAYRNGSITRREYEAGKRRLLEPGQNNR